MLTKDSQSESWHYSLGWTNYYVFFACIFIQEWSVAHAQTVSRPSLLQRRRLVSNVSTLYRYYGRRVIVIFMDFVYSADFQLVAIFESSYN